MRAFSPRALAFGYVPMSERSGGGTGPVMPETFFPIASRTFVPNESGGAENRYILSVTPHINFADLDRKNVRIRWANWRATTGLGSQIGGAAEVGSGGVLRSMSNVLHYNPNTGEFEEAPLYDVKTGDPLMITDDGGEVDAVAEISCQSGDFFWPKIAGVFDSPTGMVFAWNQADVGNGALFQYGDGWLNNSNDLATMLATTPRNLWADGRGHFSPISIRAEVDLESAGVAGDSRSSALSDVPNDEYGNIGPVGRLFGNRLPLVNVSVPGDTALDFAIAGQSMRRRRLLKEAKSRLFFIVEGTNDVIFSGQPAAPTLDAIDQIAESLGGEAIPMTLNPATADETNTTPARPQTEAERKAFNASVRARVRKLDPALRLEAAGETGLFADVSYQKDGTHETNVANALYAANPAPGDLEAIGSPPIVPAGFRYPAGAIYSSLDFTDGWVASEGLVATVGAKYGVDRKRSALLLKENSAAQSSRQWSKAVSMGLASRTAVFTVFVQRAAGLRHMMFQVQQQQIWNFGRSFIDLTSGQVNYAEGGGGGDQGITMNGTVISAYRNWFKIAMTLTFGNSAIANPFVLFKLLDGGFNETYDGDGASALVLSDLEIR